MSSHAGINERSRAAHAPPAAGPPAGSTVAIALGVAVTVLAALALSHELALGAGVVWRAGAVALAGGVLLLALVARDLHSPSFGMANTVTLLRGVLTLLLASLVGARGGEPLGWVVVVAAIVAVALDGVDGRLARSRNEASAFGARFDMETDALLILVLAALVWQLDKAGVWILAAGLLRYAFVLASYPLPWMDRPLPPSRRRQAVCVLQIVSLIGALVPGVLPPWSTAAALAGLVLLVWSFAVDVVWLARRAHA